MGIIVAIGLTSFWPISTGLAMFYLYRNRSTIKVHRGINTYLILTISAIILFSSLRAYPHSGTGIYHASVIALAPFVIANWRFNTRWINLLAGIQIIWMITEYSNGAVRPSALSDNASALGIGALMAFTPLNALAIGLSLSRTALLGFAVFAVLRNRKAIYILLLLTIVVHVSTQLWTQPKRFSIDNVIYSMELRQEAIEGTATEAIATDVIIQERNLNAFGYGYGGYVPSTGRIQPHNVYILSVWEMGFLAIPFWIILAVLLWRSRNPYMAIPALLALNVDEWYTLTEGIFFLIVFHQITRNLPVGLTFGLDKRILGRSVRKQVQEKS